MSARYVNACACVDAHVRSYKGKPTSIGHENVEMQCNGIKYGNTIMPRRLYSVHCQRDNFSGVLRETGMLPPRTRLLARLRKELPMNEE
jgi:hypothetical protein